MAVITRFSITLRVPYLLGMLLKQLRDEIEESGRLDDLLDGGYVYQPRDRRLLYDICALVDSFIFEYRSCYEVVGKFVNQFGRHILGRKIGETELLSVLRADGHDLTWIDAVREDRKLFFHRTAPWFALRVNNRHPLDCSLLIMKENLREFDDPDTYITQDQLVLAIQGLQRAMHSIQKWLEGQIAIEEGHNGE